MSPRDRSLGQRAIPPVLGTVVAVLLLVGAGGAVAVHSVSGPAAALSIGIDDSGSRTVRTVARAEDFVDHTALRLALTARGVRVPADVNIYAARIVEGRGGLHYDEFDAGGGALDTDFWPASSIKLLAALGTLDFLADQGFTGDATVTMPGYSGTVRTLYQQAVRDSSNEAYDRLLFIAGVDWLNSEFLNPANGFPRTVIQRSYTGTGGIKASPAITVSQAGRTVPLAARPARGTAECPGQGNCSNLLEMSESVRRIVLANEIPANERFAIAPDDVQGLRDALLAAQGWVEGGAAAALGNGVLVYNKPGYTPSNECVDVALINDLIDAEQFLIAISTPAEATCSTLAELTKHTLAFLSG